MKDNRPQYGLANPSLDEELEVLIREEHPNWSDKKVQDQINSTKKTMTFYNQYNGKNKSTKKPKKPKKDK